VGDDCSYAADAFTTAALLTASYLKSRHVVYRDYSRRVIYLHSNFCEAVTYNSTLFNCAAAVVMVLVVVVVAAAAMMIMVMIIIMIINSIL
jgi:hypothetical protein